MIRKINLFHESPEAFRGAPSLPEESKSILEQEARKLFSEPMDPSLLKFFPQNNSDLASDAIKALLRNIPELGELMNALNSGNGDIRQLEQLKESKINGLNVMALIIRDAVANKQSFFDYLNTVFGTQIQPETTVVMKREKISFLYAMIFTMEESAIQNNAQVKIRELRN